MSLRQIAALLVFALGTSALVRRGQVMFALLLDGNLPGVSLPGLAIFYLIMASLLLLVAVAIAFSPLVPFDAEDGR